MLVFYNININSTYGLLLFFVIKSTIKTQLGGSIMDNTKMGEIIREARKKKGLTQKDIATHLGITDRAVSKWERGICAPDIALLEPLAEILEISITELITGENEVLDKNKETVEHVVKETIQYSKQEISLKSKNANLKLIICSIIAILSGIIILLGILWYNGFFNRIARYPSPDGTTVTTVYDCKLGYHEPPKLGGFTIDDTGDYRGRTIYTNAEFRGLWWSPDNSCQVISMDTDEGIELALADYNDSNHSSLTDIIKVLIFENEFFSDVPITKDNYKDIEFDFVQWSNGNPTIMLLYFTYTDTNENFQEGYIWYNHETGEIFGEIKLH